MVLDVMGGDDPPGPAIQAAAVLADAGTSVLLCGPAAVVDGHGHPTLHAPQWVTMDDRPAAVIRATPDASIRIAARAVADGRASALVSAGSTGATVAAVRLELGRDVGVRRPVLAARIPIDGGLVLLVDAGATAEGDVRTLVRNAHLGRRHALDCGIARPTLGLLNIGIEAGKGPERLRRAARELADIDGFVGSVEPAAVLSGAVDVVITDGFTGNIVLKTLEACAPPQGPTSGDHDRDTAALVLGVRGTVLVAHGAASASQLARAVTMAGELAQSARPDGELQTADRGHQRTPQGIER